MEPTKIKKKNHFCFPDHYFKIEMTNFKMLKFMTNWWQMFVRNDCVNLHTIQRATKRSQYVSLEMKVSHKGLYDIFFKNLYHGWIIEHV